MKQKKITLLTELDDKMMTTYKERSIILQIILMEEKCLLTIKSMTHKTQLILTEVEEIIIVQILDYDQNISCSFIFTFQINSTSTHKSRHKLKKANKYIQTEKKINTKIR